MSIPAGTDAMNDLHVTHEDALSWRLGAFRPSDRTEFLKAFDSEDGQKMAFDAVVLYVQGWEQAAWLEEYSIERIGKWFGIAAPEPLRERLLDWAADAPNPARTALRRGILKGVDLPDDDKEAIMSVAH